MMVVNQSWKVLFVGAVMAAGACGVCEATPLIAPGGGLTVTKSTVPAAGAVTITTTAPANSTGPVFHETQKLFERALTPGIAGSTILGALKSTDDPALTPFFLTVSRTRWPELQLIGLLDANGVSKNAGLINVAKFLAIPEPQLIGPSLAVMIQSGHISSLQLAEVMNTAIEPSEKLMAASELVNRGKSGQALKVLDELTGSQSDSTRYYAALTLLQCKQPGRAGLGLKLLMELAARRANRLVDLKDALLARVAAQKIAPASPWAAVIARDVHNPWSLRRRAVQSLLVLNDPAGPELLANMLRSVKGTIDKIELGLLAIEYPKGLSLADLRLLRQAGSPLLTGIAKTAQLAVSGKDAISGITALIQEGQPIFLNWALAYADANGTRHRLTILNALINYATDVGDGQNADFRRAVSAATILANSDDKAVRAILATDLDSPNAGVVEAALAGMIQSHNRNFAPIIEPLWERLLKRDHRKIREFAAMELARENRKVELPVLRNIVLYGLNRSDGFRAVAGWYYVKLTGGAPALLAAIHAGIAPGGKN